MFKKNTKLQKPLPVHLIEYLSKRRVDGSLAKTLVGPQDYQNAAHLESQEEGVITLKRKVIQESVGDLKITLPC